MAKTKPQRRPAAAEKPVIVDSVEQTEGEDDVESAIEKAVKEYGPGVAAGIAVVMVVIAVGAYIYTNRQEHAAQQWLNFDTAIGSYKAEALESVANDNKDSLIAPIALSKAAVVTLQEAIGKFESDPPAARLQMESAIKKLKIGLESNTASDRLKERNQAQPCHR